MLKNKIIVKKIRNIFILLMAIIIMLGAYRNIRNSKAENVIQIEMEVSDKSNILSAQTITVDATETSDGNYLLTLPTSVNKNIVTKYYTSGGEEIVVNLENNTSTIQLTEEEVANKKVQVQSDYDTKEVIVNNQTKVFYNKELRELPNDSGTGSQDVIVTGYMPLDVDIEVKEIDLATLTSVKLPSENQTMQKAYEISIFEVVEKQGTETNTTNEVQTQTMENGEQNTESAQQDVATQADVEPQSEVAEQETTQTERVEYDSSVYGEKITVKTRQEHTNAIKTYTLAEDNKVTEVANVTSGEYVDFESDKGDKILKYIIVTQENEAEENISLMSEDTNSDIAVYASSSSNTLKSASSETSATSAFLGSPNVQRQNIESVTFNSRTTGATMPRGLIRSFDGASHSGSTWTDLTENQNGTVTGGSWGSNYLTCNGSSTWVNLGMMDKLLKNQVTLDAVISVDSLGTYHILGNQENGGLGIELISGKPQFVVYFNGDSGYTKIRSATTLTVGQKTRITGTYDGTTMSLYVDGQLVNTDLIQYYTDGSTLTEITSNHKTTLLREGTIMDSTDNTVMSLGANPIGNAAQGRYLKGKIYSAKIYNKGLTGTEIKKGWKSSEQGVQSGLIRSMDAFYNVKGEGHKRNATTWYDLTGNQNGALMNGTAAHTVSTVNSKGSWGSNYLTFDGSSDWVNLGQVDMTLTNEITLDVIIQVDATGTAYSVIGNQEVGGAGLEILANGTIQFLVYFDADGAWTKLTSSETISSLGKLGKPTRITGSYNGQQMALYVDGQLVNSVSKTGAIRNAKNDTVVAIGVNPQGDTPQLNWFKGRVYSAKIYDQGLSQSQIQQVWDVSSAGDNSILAWRTQTAPYQVNIGSNDDIYANADSSYLFSYIGYGTTCTATSVINGLGSLNTSSVTNMNYMFQYCGYRSMTKLFLGPSFDTNSVTSMTGMFQNCGYTSMTQLDLGPAFKKIASSNTSFVTNCGKSGAVIYVSSEIFYDIRRFKLSQSSGTTVSYTRGTISPRTTLESTSSETSATSGFLGNTSIQRQNVQSVTFSSDTSGAATVSGNKGLVRSFEGYKNTQSGHSTSTTTWTDLSGTSNGTVNGGATWGQNYLSLDGVNDWVDLGQVSLTNQVTLDTIVEINSASSEKQAILGNPQNGGVLLQIFEQKVYFWLWTSEYSYYTIINSDTELTLGKPTRITGTYNGLSMRLYIDGQLEAEQAVSGTIVAPGESTPMAIGSNRKGTGTSGNGEFAKANIYSAKVYTQALTQSEIQQVWDVSELGDYSIMAWYDASSSPYTVNIASSFDMYANANSSYLFSYIGFGDSCTATDVIDKMNLLNTQCVTNMRGMFQYCGYKKMTSFSLGNKFDTTNVTDMAYMFYYCGTTAMTSLDLGPAFTAIASSKTNFAEKCGKDGSITIYSGSAIYSNSNAFRLGANSTVTESFTRGTINPKYRPEWSVQSYSVSGSSLVVTLQGNVNTANYTGDSLKTVTNRFTNGSTNLVRVNVDGDSSANSTITKTISNASSTTAQTVTCTLTLGNFAESARQSGKNFLEWSGNVLLDYIPTTIEDAYGNPNIAESDGTTMFTDTIKPEFTYEYTNTTIDHGTKTVTIVFDVADKFFSSSALSTDSSASNIDVVVGGVTATNATKTLTKIEDLSTTINGTSKKTGERYRLVITNLDQGGGNDYSGIMTLAFPADIVTDTSSNGNLAKTITVGIDDPTNGDGHDSGVIVDVVDPIWKIENINIDKTGKKVTADLIATDKYLTGVENSSLTTNDITVSVDDDVNANTVITKSLTEPTFSTNETTGLKEIKYTLTLNNFEEATKQTGKSFLEYSGAVEITVAAGTITDVPSETGGSTSQTQSNSSKEQEFQLGQVDFLNPRFIYEYANTTINHETKTVTVVFDATDKYFNSSALSTDTTASNITVIVDGTTATNATKSLTKLQDITETVNGTSKKVGEKYQLVISNLDQGDGKSYSGVMTLAFPENIVTDTDTNGNLAKTITIGIDDPTTGDGHDTGIIVDVVDPIWKVENINIDKTNKKVTADLIATDKYLTGVENSSLTTNDITVSVDDDVNANTVITKSLTEPTFSTNETTGLKEIKYTLTLNNFEEATKQTGKSFLEYSGAVEITVAAGTITDVPSETGGSTSQTQSNTSKEQEFELGHVDFIKPRIEKQSATKDETAKTETIILNVMDKYLDTTDALENSEITVYIDGENVTGLTKTLSKNTRTTATTSGGVTYETNGDITAIVNGTSQIVGQQYKLVLSDFEQATNNSKKYKDWSGTVSIDVAEGAVKDQISASTANTSDAVTVKGDFVDFIAPYLTYQYLTTDIDREGTDADGKSFQMAFEVTDKYYESGKLSIDDLSIQIADGKHTYDLKNTPVTITLNSDESITAPNVKMTNKTTGEVETVTSTTIGHRYVLTISNLEQLEIAEGNTTLDYSGIVTVSVDANKISDRSGNKNIAKTITSGVSIPDETGDGVVVDVVKPIWRKTSDGSIDFGTKTANIVVKGTDTYYASNSLTVAKLRVYAYSGTTQTDITSSVNPTLSAATRLDESVTVNGTTSTRQYGVQYTITLTNIPVDKDQVKIIIPADTLTDQSGNTNDVYEIKLFATLKSAVISRDEYGNVYSGEKYRDSGFLGNSSIQRQNIESVTFLTSASGAANNKWDVSAAQDGSIWAWYTGSGPYQVYIGSDEFMCANQDSGYLFSHIGSGSNSTATNVINGLEYLNTVTATNMNGMFSGCGYTSMTSLDLGDKFDTSNVTDMREMFYECGYTAMTSLVLGEKFDTSKVTNMRQMFDNCGREALRSLSLGEKFNTSNVTNMNSMFPACGLTTLTSLDLGDKFDTSNVTDMSDMFSGLTALPILDLGDKFNTSNVTNMSNMFSELTALTSLDLGDKFDTSNVTNHGKMFAGCTAITTLDLGPKFTKIASDENSGFMTNCGTTGAVIYAPEAIYKDRISFKLNSGDTSTASGAIPVDAGRTINPIYKPEWEKVSSSLDTTTNPENPTVSVVVKGSANKSETINGVNINYNSQVTSGLTKDNISVYIDGELDGDTNKNGKIDAGETPSITKTVTSASPSATSAEVTHTITLSGLEEALRQNGKSFKEWSGNIAIKIGGRGEATDTYTANVLTDEYGNQSMMETDASGTWIDVLYKDTDTDHNVNGTMFADFVKPEFTYEYSNTTINHETKTVTIVFDVTDKYFNSSALLTDTTASNIDVVVGGTTPTNATKELTKLQDLTATVNGTSKKVGERYQLVITNLDQGGGNDYSGIMTLAFPADIITDMSTNGNLAKTITIGIDDPTTGDGDDTGVIVDVVDPIWKVENINIDKTNKKVTADLIATDKYLTGVENSSLTTNDITVSVDDDVNANTVITKSLTEPTFSTNETT